MSKPEERLDLIPDREGEDDGDEEESRDQGEEAPLRPRPLALVLELRAPSGALADERSLER